MSKYITTIELGENTSSGKILRWVKPGSTVLEFGPSSGRMTKYMKEELGCTVYIVEINKEDYELARAYAYDGVNGDILQFAWCEKFKDVKFDTILLADVLEHLADPFEALRRAADFLKDDGEVLTSIPNMAHNDIILSLLNDEFRYTKTGLLDNTHVHFFAYHDLMDFCRKAGYTVVEQEAVYVPTFSTEQKVVQTAVASDLHVRYLRNRQFGEVYQFIFRMKKAAKDASRQPDQEWPVSFGGYRQMFSSVYFDTGDGFNEDEKRSVFVNLADNGTFSVKVSLQGKVGRIRFDPTETSFLLVKDIAAASEDKNLPVTPLNGHHIGAYTFFATQDPMYEIPVPEEAKWITISGRAALVRDKMWADVFNEAFSRNMEGVPVRPATCFYDIGRSFCQEDSVTVVPLRQVDGMNRYHYFFPEPTRCVRFDPMEGGGCFVRGLSVAPETLSFSFVTNGEQTASGILFMDDDPQIRIDLDKEVKELYIIAEVVPFK